MKTLQSSDCKDLANFQNVNELLDINQNEEILKHRVNLINVKAAEFYHSLILCKDGTPVATGTINITQLPIVGKEVLEDDQQWTTNYTDPDQPFE